MLETPKFIQGVYSFEGHGLRTPTPLRPEVAYVVPRDRKAQLIYLRAGNSSPELVYLLLRRDGKPMRYFPIGAKSAIHVPLAIIEDIHPESVLELWAAAPEGVRGQLPVDMGLAEV